MNDKKTFGNFISLKRRKKGFTQKEFALRLHMTESAVSKWERGISYPDITLIKTICEILDLTEHELITASIDNKQRKESIQARRFRNISKTYHLFFVVAYSITLITCFIVNLAVSQSLTWFFIVFASILTAFTLTTLPKFINKYKLMIISLSFMATLTILLGIICLYTKGNWFFISASSILLAYLVFIIPIILKRYKIPRLFKNHTALVSYIMNVLGIIIFLFVCNEYVNGDWLITKAYPITLVSSIIPLLFIVIIRYIKINWSFKTTICLIINAISTYGINLFVSSILHEKVYYIFDLTNWSNSKYIEANVKVIIALSLVFLAVIFGIVGIVINNRNKVQTKVGS